MVRGMNLFALLAATFFTLVAAEVEKGNLLTALSQLPSCGLTCFQENIAASTCSPLNVDCYCTDANFLKIAGDCVLDECSTLQGLQIQKAINHGCGNPQRNRKHSNMFIYIIEVPAAICPWLRLYASLSIQKKLALDDYLMTITGILYIPFVVIGAWVSQYAFGQDIWNVEPDVVITGLKWFYIDEAFYLVCLCLTKVSVLCFLLRIFPSRAFRWSTFATMGFIIVPSFILLMLQIFQCRPIHLIWDGWVTKTWEENCLNLTLLSTTAATFSIAQEAIMLLLPMPAVFKLNANLKTKVGVVIMFSLGIFVLATSCARLSYILAFGHTSNPTWDYVDPINWTGLETAVAIIVACLPALRLLLLRAIPRLASSSKGFSNKISSIAADRYGKLGFSKGEEQSSVSKTHRSTRGTGRSSTGNDSQIELEPGPFDNSYEDNGYRCKTPTEVKVAAASPSESGHENHYHHHHPSRGILVENELTVNSTYEGFNLTSRGVPKTAFD